MKLKPIRRMLGDSMWILVRGSLSESIHVNDSIIIQTWGSVKPVDLNIHLTISPISDSIIRSIYNKTS